MEVKIGSVYFIPVSDNTNDLRKVIVDSLDGDVVYYHTVKKYGKAKQHKHRKCDISKLVDYESMLEQIRLREEQKRREMELQKMVWAFVDSIEIVPVEITRALRRKVRRIEPDCSGSCWDDVAEIVEDMMFSATMPTVIPDELPVAMVEEDIRDRIRDSDCYIETSNELAEIAEAAWHMH